MASSQLTAFYMSQSRAVRDPETKHPPRRGRGLASGPVHRPGPTWYHTATLNAEDPAVALMAPPTRFNARLRRAMRAVTVLTSSLMLTPVLPAILA